MTAGGSGHDGLPPADRASCSRRRVLLACAAGAAAAWLPFAPHAAGSAPALAGQSVFRIVRRGADIGEHSITLQGRDDHLVATTEVDITMRVLGVPVHRYRLRVEETWRDGVLATFRSRGDDNGAKISVDAERDGDELVVEAGGEVRRIGGRVVTTSLWHGETPYEGRLLGMEDGRVKQVTGRFLSEERLTLASLPQPVDARRYDLRGEFERELWYDERRRLVRVAFQTRRDGSRIEFVLKALAGEGRAPFP